jgi:hypothetical protein
MLGGIACLLLLLLTCIATAFDPIVLPINIDGVARAVTLTAADSLELVVSQFAAEYDLAAEPRVLIEQELRKRREAALAQERPFAYLGTDYAPPAQLKFVLPVPLLLEGCSASPDFTYTVEGKSNGEELQLHARKTSTDFAAAAQCGQHNAVGNMVLQVVLDVELQHQRLSNVTSRNGRMTAGLSFGDQIHQGTRLDHSQPVNQHSRILFPSDGFALPMVSWVAVSLVLTKRILQSTEVSD